METKNKQHVLTLKFSTPVPPGVLTILKDRFADVKTEIKGNTLILSNLHFDDANEILETVKQEDSSFVHTLKRNTGFNNNLISEQNRLLLELESGNITINRAAMVCHLLMSKYNISSYTTKNGSGIQYIKDGKMCDISGQIRDNSIGDRELAKFAGKPPEVTKIIKGSKATMIFVDEAKDMEPKTVKTLAEYDCKTKNIKILKQEITLEKFGSHKIVMASREKLESLVYQGNTMHQIADMLKMDYDTLRYRIKVLGLLKAVKKNQTRDKTIKKQLASPLVRNKIQRKAMLERKPKIEALIKQGKGIKAMADDFGIPVNTFRYQLQALGLLDKVIAKREEKEINKSVAVNRIASVPTVKISGGKAVQSERTDFTKKPFIPITIFEPDGEVVCPRYKDCIHPTCFHKIPHVCKNQEFVCDVIRKTIRCLSVKYLNYEPAKIQIGDTVRIKEGHYKDKEGMVCNIEWYSLYAEYFYTISGVPGVEKESQIELIKKGNFKRMFCFELGDKVRVIQTGQEGYITAQHLANDKITYEFENEEDKKYSAADFELIEAHTAEPSIQKLMAEKETQSKKTIEHTCGNCGHGQVCHIKRKLEVVRGTIHWSLIARCEKWQPESN